jgi:branched-chain amino acid transport system permease protein
VVSGLADSGAPGWVAMLMSLLCAMVVCSALNFAIEKLAYRPLRNAPRLAPLITAMGMSLLLQTVAMIIWKPNPKPYPILLPSEPINLGGPVISVVQCLILGLTAVILAALMYLVNKTKLGRAMREARHGHLGHFHHRRHARSRGWCDVGRQLRHRAALDGVFARP